MKTRPTVGAEKKYLKSAKWGKGGNNLPFRSRSSRSRHSKNKQKKDLFLACQPPTLDNVLMRLCGIAVGCYNIGEFFNIIL